MLDALARFLSTSSTPDGGPTIPEWEGWVVLGALMAMFGAIVWWLYASPLPPVEHRMRRAPMGLSARRILAGFVLLSGMLLVVGARWDEFWHRLYGGFGDDFLWPPHLMIYGSLGLNSAFAVLGLALAARGGGGLRERFRANPLVGLLGLLASYQLASIPSDLIWHKIIGPDISAWSLPHLLLTVSSTAVLVIGLALALSGRRRRPWRIIGWASPVEWIAFALIVVSTLALLQFGVTEWEWRGDPGMPYDRALWVYPVVVLTIGIAEAHVALYGLRRVGAATAVAVVALVTQLAFVHYARVLVPPGPVVASHLLLVVPAVSLDLWYAARLSRAAELATFVIGVAAYVAVAVGEAVLLVGKLMSYPTFALGDLASLVGLGLGGGLTVAAIARLAVTWLVVGRGDDAAVEDSGSRSPAQLTTVG